jgi:hypothetical protein
MAASCALSLLEIARACTWPIRPAPRIASFFIDYIPFKVMLLATLIRV